MDRRASSCLMVGLAAVMAAYFTLVYYPGVLYSDSYSRWGYAHAILDGGFKSTFHSIGPSLWMAATYAVTGNYAAYTLLQAFFFFLSVLMVVRRAAALEGWWLLVPAVVLAALPLFPGYSVFHEAGVGAVTAMNFLLVLLLREDDEPERALAPWLEGALLLVLAFTLLSFRQNALTVLPLLVYVVWRRARATAARLISIGALAGAIALLPVVPRALHYTLQDSSGISFAWEMAQTLQTLDRPEYEHYLDALGNTKVAVAAKIDNDIWSGLFGPSALDYGAVGAPSMAARLRRDYLRLLVAEPRAVLANKWRSWKRVLGVGQPLYFYEFDENRWGQMPQFGWRDTPTRHRAFERVEKMMRMRVLRTPWIVFLVAAAAVVAATRATRRRQVLLTAAVVLAAFYYAAFLLTAPAYEFRYFFPSFCLLFTVLLATAISAARSLVGAALRARRVAASARAGAGTQGSQAAGGPGA